MINGTEIFTMVAVMYGHDKNCVRHQVQLPSTHCTCLDEKPKLMPMNRLLVNGGES